MTEPGDCEVCGHTYEQHDTDEDGRMTCRCNVQGCGCDHYAWDPQEQQAQVRAAWSNAGVYKGYCLCREVDRVSVAMQPLDTHPLNRHCPRCGLGPNLD